MPRTALRWEPLYEATQIKGDGETHPFLSPNDEFANFERWDKGNLDLTEVKKPEMLEFEYARSALKNGLKMEAELGVNPYKFGLVGSTDAHTGLAAVEEDNFFGKTSSSEPSADRATHPFVKTDKAVIMGWETDGVGLCRGVGDREYARGDLRRHEAPRDLRHHRPAHDRALLRRLGFRGRATPTTACRRRVGYTKGVPMGGDLSAAPQGKSPTFLVAALKDPIGANLDRIQIIKGWLGKDGKTQERIYDVAVSGGRTIGADGRSRDVRRQHGRRRERDLDQHDRRGRDDHGLEGPGLRSGVARVLLRARDRNPDAALDRVRREILRHQDAQRKSR